MTSLNLEYGLPQRFIIERDYGNDGFSVDWFCSAIMGDGTLSGCAWGATPEEALAGLKKILRAS